MNLHDPEPVLLTTEQTARMLGISRRSVATLCRKGQIRAVRLGEGGRWRIVRAGVEEIVLSEAVAKAYQFPRRELLPSSTPETNEGGEAA